MPKKQRKPMSEEQKQKMREQAKARWEAKKAAQANTEPEQAPETQNDTQEPAETTTQNEPEQVQPAEAQEKPSESQDVEDVLSIVSTARDVVHRTKYLHPHMIEAVQAEEALDEAMRKLGQVAGLLKETE